MDNSDSEEEHRHSPLKSPLKRSNTGLNPHSLNTPSVSDDFLRLENRTTNTGGPSVRSRKLSDGNAEPTSKKLFTPLIDNSSDSLSNSSTFSLRPFPSLENLSSDLGSDKEYSDPFEQIPLYENPSEGEAYFFWEQLDCDFKLYANSGTLLVEGLGDSDRADQVLRILNPNGLLILADGLTGKHVLAKADNITHKGQNNRLKALEVWATGNERVRGLFLNAPASSLNSEEVTFHEGNFRNQNIFSSNTFTHRQDLGPESDRIEPLVVNDPGSKITIRQKAKFDTQNLKLMNRGEVKVRGKAKAKNLYILNEGSFAFDGQTSFTGVTISNNQFFKIKRLLEGTSLRVLNYERMTFVGGGRLSQSYLHNDGFLKTQKAFSLTGSLAGQGLKNRGFIEAEGDFSHFGQTFEDTKDSALTVKGHLTLKTVDPLTLQGTTQAHLGAEIESPHNLNQGSFISYPTDEGGTFVKGRLTNEGIFTTDDFEIIGPLEERILFNDGGQMTLGRLLEPVHQVQNRFKPEELKQDIKDRTSFLKIKEGPVKSGLLDNQGRFIHAKGLSKIKRLSNENGYAFFDGLQFEDSEQELKGTLQVKRYVGDKQDPLESLSILGSVSFEKGDLPAGALLIDSEGKFWLGEGLHELGLIDNQGILIPGEGADIQTEDLQNAKGRIESNTSLRMIVSPNEKPQTKKGKTPTLTLTRLLTKEEKNKKQTANFSPGTLAAREDLTLELAPSMDIFGALKRFNHQWNQGRTLKLYGNKYIQSEDFYRGGHLFLKVNDLELYNRSKLTANALDLTIQNPPIVQGEIHTVKDPLKSDAQDTHLTATIEKGDVSLPEAGIFGDGVTTLKLEGGHLVYGGKPIYEHKTTDISPNGNYNYFRFQNDPGYYQDPYKHHYLKKNKEAYLGSNNALNVEVPARKNMTFAYTNVEGKGAGNFKAPLGEIHSRSSKILLQDKIFLKSNVFKNDREKTLTLYSCPDLGGTMRAYKDFETSDKAELISLNSDIEAEVNHFFNDASDIKAGKRIYNKKEALRGSSSFTNQPRVLGHYYVNESFAGGANFGPGYDEQFPKAYGRNETLELLPSLVEAEEIDTYYDVQNQHGTLSARILKLTGDSLFMEGLFDVKKPKLNYANGKGMIEALIKASFETSPFLKQNHEGNIRYTVPFSPHKRFNQLISAHEGDLPILKDQTLETLSLTNPTSQGLEPYAPLDVQYQAFLNAYSELTGRSYLEVGETALNGEDMLIRLIKNSSHYARWGQLKETRLHEFPHILAYFKIILNHQGKPSWILDLYLPDAHINLYAGNAATIEAQQMKLKFEGHSKLKGAFIHALGKDTKDAPAMDIHFGSLLSEPIIEKIERDFQNGHFTSEEFLRKKTEFRSSRGSASILTDGPFHAVATKFMAAKKMTLGSEKGDTVLEPATLKSVFKSWSYQSKDDGGPFGGTATETRTFLEKRQAFELTEVMGGEQVTFKAGKEGSLYYLIPRIQAGKDGIVFDAKKLSLKGAISKNSVATTYNKTISGSLGGISGVDRWDSSYTETPTYHEGQILTKGPLTFQNEQAEVDGCTVVALKGIIDKTRTLRFGCIKEEINSHCSEGKESYKGSAEAQTSVKQDVVIQPQVFAPFMISEADPQYDNSPLTAELVLESALFNIPVKVTLRKNLREEMVTVRYEERSHSSAEGFATASLEAPKILPQLPKNLDGKSLAAQMTEVMNGLSGALNTGANALNLMSGDLSALLGILEQYATLEFTTQSSKTDISKTQQLPNILNIGHLNIKADSWKHAGHANIEFIIGEIKDFKGEPIKAQNKINAVSENESVKFNLSNGTVSHSYNKKQHYLEANTSQASTLQGRVMDLKTDAIDLSGNELTFDYLTLAADKAFLKSVLDEFIEITKEKGHHVSITPSPDPVAMLVSVASSIDYKNDLDAIIKKKIGAKSSLTGTKHLDLLIGHLTRTHDAKIKGPEDLGTPTENAYQTIGGNTFYEIPLPNDRELARRHGFDPDDIGMTNDSLLVGLIGAKTRGEALKDLLDRKGEDNIRKLVSPEIIIAFKEAELPLTLSQSPAYKKLEKTYKAAFETQSESDDEDSPQENPRRSAVIQNFEQERDDFLNDVSEDYIEQMRYSSGDEVLWGGDIELLELANLHNLRITVHQPYGNNIVANPPIGAEGGQEVHLWLSGNHYQNYDPLLKKARNVPKDGNCLFHAVARAINGTDESTLEDTSQLRNAVADRLQALVQEIKDGKSRTYPGSEESEGRPVTVKLTNEANPIRSRFAMIFEAETIEHLRNAIADLPPSSLLEEAVAIKTKMFSELSRVDAEEKVVALTALESWSLQESTFEGYLKATLPLTDYTFPYSDKPEVTTTLDALCQIYGLDLAVYEKNAEGKLAPVHQFKGGDKAVNLLKKEDGLDGSVFSKLKGYRQKVDIKEEVVERLEETTQHIKKRSPLTKLFEIVRLGASAYNLHKAVENFSEAVKRFKQQTYQQARDQGDTQEEALEKAKQAQKVLEDPKLKEAIESLEDAAREIKKPLKQLAAQEKALRESKQTSLKKEQQKTGFAEPSLQEKLSQRPTQTPVPLQDIDPTVMQKGLSAVASANEFIDTYIKEHPETAQVLQQTLEWSGQLLQIYAYVKAAGAGAAAGAAFGPIGAGVGAATGLMLAHTALQGLAYATEKAIDLGVDYASSQGKDNIEAERFRNAAEGTAEKFLVVASLMGAKKGIKRLVGKNTHRLTPQGNQATNTPMQQFTQNIQGAGNQQPRLPSDLKSCLRDLELKAGQPVSLKQKEFLGQALRKTEYKPLEELAKKEHSNKFTPAKRDNLISEWKKNTGQEWPLYTEPVYKKDGNIFRNIGDKYEAHHIIPQQIGGPHEWWNMYPVSQPQHQGGVHGKGAPLNKLIKGLEKK